MAKLTKQEARRHAQAVEMLKQDVLTSDEKEFVFRNYHEAANHVNGSSGAFFTPFDLAWEFALDAMYNDESRVYKYIDLCAGIGVLSYSLLLRAPNAQITCVEINPDYVEVGKKLVPEATWICGDVTDKDLMASLGFFDCAYSNPPFGAVPSFSGKRGPNYSGSESEYKVIDIASKLASTGSFIIPQMSAGFKYSGVQYYQRDEEDQNDKYYKFQNQTGIYLDIGMGIDTSLDYFQEWKGCKPRVEFAHAEFDDIKPVVVSDDRQFDLFMVA